MEGVETARPCPLLLSGGGTWGLWGWGAQYGAGGAGRDGDRVAE